MSVGKVVNKEESKGTLRYGMVGGGPGSFIGSVHRAAIRMENKANLIAGSFSSVYEESLEAGKELGLNKDRIYENYKEMAEKEAKRDDSIDFISITTPNHLHYDVAKTFLKKGINVACEKPLVFTVEEAEELAELAEKNDLYLCVTYTYTGFPMVKHAREMVKKGDIGEIRMVMGEYPQGWLAKATEEEGNKQAEWRTDPELAGRSNAVGDIGSHIENLVSYITGLEIESVLAELDSLGGNNRSLDTNASIMVKFDNGAKGVYWCSQVAIGYDNALKVRIFGSKGTIEWEVEKPDILKVTYLDQATQYLSRGRDELYALGEKKVRLPAGHPEGYIDAFANIYKDYCQALLAKKAGNFLSKDDRDFPTVFDGIEGVRFINRVVDSSEAGAKWVEFNY